MQKGEVICSIQDVFNVLYVSSLGVCWVFFMKSCYLPDTI